MIRKVLLIITIILIIPSFIFSATKKEIKGEIAGITPKKVSIHTEEEIKEGDKVKITRGENLIAELKVIKIRGKIVEAEIIEIYGGIDFDNKVIKEVEEIEEIKKEISIKLQIS